MYIEFIKGQKYPTKNARVSENLEDFNDAGYLLEDDILVVDIDISEKVNTQFTKEGLKTLLDMNDVKTKTVETDRGWHLYFKRPENLNGASGKGELGGIPVELEYKHSGNTKAVTVKRFSEARNVINEGTFQDLPECLFDKSAVYEIQPMKSIVPYTGSFDFDLFKQCVEVLNEKGYFDEGGNYQNWASFVNALARMEEEERITHDQALDICRIFDINGSTFDKYERALAEPKINFGHIVNVMKNNGILAIKQVCECPIEIGDWWTEGEKGGKKFAHYILADYIKQNFNLIRYGDESGILYYYDNQDGFYKMDANWKLLNGTIRTLDKTLTIQQVKEVATSIYESATVIKEWSRTHIPLKNGLWDIKNNCLTSLTPNVLVDYKIDIKWNETAYSEFIDETLNKISNFHKPTRVNLEEILGSVISPELLSRFVWFLFGRTAHNGKSYFLYLISRLLNEKFIGTLSPHDVAKSQFKIAELYGKKVNLVDETGDKPIPDFDKIKLLVTGGMTTIEHKGKGGFTVKLEVPQVWCSNFFPNIKEEGDQVNRRVEIIPFDYNFKADPNRLADYVAENQANTDEVKEYL